MVNFFFLLALQFRIKYLVFDIYESAKGKLFFWIRDHLVGLLTYIDIWIDDKV